MIHQALVCSMPMQSSLPRIVQRLVCLAAKPEVMQYDRQLAGHRDVGAFLSRINQILVFYATRNLFK